MSTTASQLDHRPTDPLPSWVRVDHPVVELSATRGIVLTHTKIRQITPTHIELWCGKKYLRDSLCPAADPHQVTFTRPNSFLPGVRVRLASPAHPEAR
ncbi:hypothetical protein [Nocardia otitidiscaviarum]|uniref:hypothetical protein n=1 Tax=Nocardia otitidiscaviarum TaxID=1823 RepID=UPI001892D315|nr:hypothetical protein [Nocardia otitidiscaviarum]MBF6237473.1 hypothetical protein [Nocardia otitidiscaviarum]